MYFEISAILAVIIFAILTFYIIRTLITVRRSLQRLDHLLFELDHKIKHMESTLKTISNIGDICEEKTKRLREHYLENQALEPKKVDDSEELTDWLLASLKLGSKFLRRK